MERRSSSSREEDVEAGRACLRPAGEQNSSKSKKTRLKGACNRSMSAMKLYCLALLSMLVALIYLTAETKAGVEIADKILTTTLRLLIREHKAGELQSATNSSQIDNEY